MVSTNLGPPNIGFLRMILNFWSLLSKHKKQMSKMAHGVTDSIWQTCHSHKKWFIHTPRLNNLYSLRFKLMKLVYRKINIWPYQIKPESNTEKLVITLSLVIKSFIYMYMLYRRRFRYWWQSLLHLINLWRENSHMASLTELSGLHPNFQFDSIMVPCVFSLGDSPIFFLAPLEILEHPQASVKWIIEACKKILYGNEIKHNVP